MLDRCLTLPNPLWSQVPIQPAVLHKPLSSEYFACKFKTLKHFLIIMMNAFMTESWWPVVCALHYLLNTAFGILNNDGLSMKT